MILALMFVIPVFLMYCVNIYIYISLVCVKPGFLFRDTAASLLHIVDVNELILVSMHRKPRIYNSREIIRDLSFVFTNDG